jgi:hypothetical protein
MNIRVKAGVKTRGLVRQFQSELRLFMAHLIKSDIKGYQIPVTAIKISARVSRIIKRVDKGLKLLSECQPNWLVPVIFNKFNHFY